MLEPASLGLEGEEKKERRKKETNKKNQCCWEKSWELLKRGFSSLNDSHSPHDFITGYKNTLSQRSISITDTPSKQLPITVHQCSPDSA